jgi:hypothetical protein
MVMDENSSVSSRNPIDVAHFALFMAGLLIGMGAVVINCICVAVFGVFLVGWSLLYFLVTG